MQLHVQDWLRNWIVSQKEGIRKELVWDLRVAIRERERERETVGIVYSMASNIRDS